MAVLALLASGCGTQGAVGRSASMRDAQTLAASIDMGWNAGNALEAFAGDAACSETSWGNPPLTRELIDAVAAAGFNAVRIPVRWYPHFGADGVTVDEAWMRRVKEVVDGCMEAGLFVILNTHHEGWMESFPFYADSAAVYGRERRLWEQIATAFRDYDDRLLFAGTNEVHVPDHWGEPTAENAEVQNGYNRVFVETVRRTGGRNARRALIVQTYVANPDFGPSLLTVPADSEPGRLLVEVHFYSPYPYCMGATQRYWGNPYRQQGAPEGQEEELEQVFARLRARYVDQGIPVLLGEFGAAWSAPDGLSSEEEKNMRASRAYYYGKVVAAARRNGAVPFVWDNGYLALRGDGFALFDRRNTAYPCDTAVIARMREAVRVPYPFQKKDDK